MKAAIAALGLIASFAAGSALAQTMPPNETGVTMGHLHLNSVDVAANAKIFAGMGGTVVKAEGAPLQYARFPGVIVILNLPPGAPPSSGGTSGTEQNQLLHYSL